jgi:hypothetical protein
MECKIMAGVRTIIATAVLATVAGGACAWAQVDLRALRQQNEIRQQQDIARQDTLAAQRELSAAQSRYATQQTLRSLGEAGRPSTGPLLRPTVAPPPRGPSADDLATDAERMERLTDERLAASNARLRAVTPAH